MKKQILQIGVFITGILFLCFMACRKETGTALTSSKELSASANKATTFTSNEKQPIDIIIFIPCANGGAGENVELTGTIHILIHTTLNGNNFTTKYHFQPQGISGTGQTTGIKYQGSGVTQEEIKGSFNNGKYIDTYINNFKVVGQGKGNNYTVHDNMHITVNANGETTATVDNFTSDCK